VICLLGNSHLATPHGRSPLIPNEALGFVGVSRPGVDSMNRFFSPTLKQKDFLGQQFALHGILSQLA